MRIYRVKEKNERFYPQYKNGWKTAWCWEYFYETPIIVYPGGNWRTHDDSVKWDCDTLQQANEIIESDRKKREIKYHVIL